MCWAAHIGQGREQQLLSLACLMQDPLLVMHEDFESHPLPELLACVTGGAVALQWEGRVGTYPCLLISLGQGRA